MNKQLYPKKIIILGGGSAGWMAASLLQKAWGQHNVNITLVESSDIGTIGVGEGSTPYMREFFKTLGISETQWMPACNATFKCGISFPNWQKDTKAGYFHPFFSQLDLDTGNAFFANCTFRRKGKKVPAHPDDFFVSAELARENKAPIASRALPFEPDYGYHFDAGLVAEFLKKFCIKQGLKHKIATIKSIQQGANGEITELTTADKQTFKADFFIDCTGFASVLIGKTLAVPFKSFADNLFNDSAIAIPTKTNNENSIASFTQATAMDNGWAWKIPLINRIGNGYVYSSQFCSDDQAENEFRNYLGDEAHDMESRLLKMKIGRTEKHWHKNCLAVGLSQGFIEPLEATALMLVQITIVKFIELYDNRKQSQDNYNNEINKYFDGVLDYVVAHYKLNSRTDTQYWQANREHDIISDSLRDIISTWEQGGDFEACLNRHDDNLVYLRPSWYCILAGMNKFPNRLTKPLKSKKITDPQQTRAYCQQAATIFPDHKTYLKQLYTNNQRAHQ